MKECKIEPQNLVDLSQAQESLSRITQQLLSDTKLDAKQALKDLYQANKELTAALRTVTLQLREAAKPIEVPEPPAAVLTTVNRVALTYPIEKMGFPTNNAIRNARLVVLDYKNNLPIAYQIGIKTVGELVQFRADELASIGRFGEKTAKLFLEPLETLGLSLGMKLETSQLKELGVTNFRKADAFDEKLEFRELIQGQLAIKRKAQQILGEHVRVIPGLSEGYIDNLNRVCVSTGHIRREKYRFEKVEKVWEFVQLSLGRDMFKSGNNVDTVAQFLLDHGLCFGMKEFPAQLVKNFGIENMVRKWDLRNAHAIGAMTEKEMGHTLDRVGGR